jgi:hypothetical protein
MEMIKKGLENDVDILPVWFDAWRYEREKYVAVIPFLRQIAIVLENHLKENKKRGMWNNVKSGLVTVSIQVFTRLTLSHLASVMETGLLRGSNGYFPNRK